MATPLAVMEGARIQTRSKTFRKEIIIIITLYKGNIYIYLYNYIVNLSSQFIVLLQSVGSKVFYGIYSSTLSVV